MNTYDKNSWKSIIDPEFDSVVKKLLGYIKQIKDFTTEGYLSALNKITLKSVLNKAQWTTAYSGNILQDISKSKAIKDLDADTDIFKIASEIDNLKSDPAKLFAGSLLMAEKLPERSRQYYQEKINSIIDGSMLKPIENVDNKQKERNVKSNRKALSAIVTSIICRYFFQEFDKLLDKLDDKNKSLQDPIFIRLFVSSLFTTLSQITNQSTISELLSKGDDKSLFKAIAIDKSILTIASVKKRIEEAQLSGDKKFFKKLGEASAKEPLSKEAIHYETYIVLKLFWLTGLNRLKPKQLYSFLNDCSLNPPEYPAALDKFLRRHIYPVYGK